MKISNPEYEKYIHSTAWHELAEKRMQLDRCTCRVCGKDAIDVHHLTYDRFRHEELSDLVSLCRKCHKMAEEICDPTVYPWAMSETKPNGNNFMAAMRVDATRIAPAVFDYIKSSRGQDFDALMELRQPTDPEKKKYWGELKVAVNALCRKRYAMNCVEDRADIMLETVTNHIAVIALSKIEHAIRNAVQKGLHETVVTEYAILEKWKEVGEYLGITNGTLQKMKSDDGTSFGPSLRETVLYYCGLDASAGIYPLPSFTCLSQEDYNHLITLADYMNNVSGNSKFKGEYKEEQNHA